MDQTNIGQVDLTIRQVLSQLPAFEDDIYLGMQATNLDVVDGQLRELEKELLQAYIQLERTPIPQAIFVSALSQLWIFGLYELLRTWRQRLSDLLTFSDALSDLSQSEKSIELENRRKKYENQSPYLDETHFFIFRPYQKVVEDEAYRVRLINAKNSSEPLFRKLEALRMSLAKHEIPGKQGSTALAPGYGRIDMTTGSIYWQVALSVTEIDIVSRKTLSAEVPSLLEDVSQFIISESLQQKIKTFPKYSYALKCVTAILSDGKKFPGTLVAWNKMIVRVLEYEDLPFSGADIVDIHSNDT